MYDQCMLLLNKSHSVTVFCFVLFVLSWWYVGGTTEWEIQLNIWVAFFVFKVFGLWKSLRKLKIDEAIVCVCMSIFLCVSLASDSWETIEVIKLGMVTASDMVMHRVFIILTLTFIQGHTSWSWIKLISAETKQREITPWQKVAQPVKSPPFSQWDLLVFFCDVWLWKHLYGFTYLVL